MTRVGDYKFARFSVGDGKSFAAMPGLTDAHFDCTKRSLLIDSKRTFLRTKMGCLFVASEKGLQSFVFCRSRARGSVSL